MPKRIIVPAVDDGWDDATQTFFTIPETKLTLEHSLVSISKWESKWEKPFLKDKNKTAAEMLDYIRCMTLTQCVNDNVYTYMPGEIISEIWSYVEAQMSALDLSQDPMDARPEGAAPSREVITSEVIYSWMVEYGIPFECEKWHLNRLLNLIKILNKRARIRGGNQKKMSMSDIMRRNSQLNAKRRAQLGSKG